MNTQNIITRTVVIVFFLMIFISFSAFAKSPYNADIIKRVENLNTIIEVRVTEEVIKQIKLTVESWREDSEIVLGRSSLYFPVIENVLREKNLPDELKYIAVIESALLPRAKSNQGATGMWQFMKGTAELFGLKINKHIDERKDVLIATEKATDYLQLLYETYGNWTTALAAYNCGTGRVNKAIKKAGGSKEYWTIAQYLPTETKRYIPRFIAAAYLMNYYYLHDLSPIFPSDDIRYTASVKVFQKTDLKKLSKELDLDFDLVTYLNPVYVKDYIPAAGEGEYYLLTLPDYKMSAFIDRFSSVQNLVYSPLSLKRPLTTDAIQPEIVSASRTSKDYINFLSKQFTIVRDNLKDTSMLKNLSKGVLPGRERMKLYQLGKKESLADVAEAKNIPLADLISINNIDESKGLPPGSIIILSR